MREALASSARGGIFRLGGLGRWVGVVRGNSNGRLLGFMIWVECEGVRRVADELECRSRWKFEC